MDEPGLPPRNELERTLATIWCHVLGVDTVGILDDFYSMGGHSLLAVSLSSRVTSQLHVDFSVEDVERWPTIASQAEAIIRALTGHDGVDSQQVKQAASPNAPLAPPVREVN